MNEDTVVQIVFTVILVVLASVGGYYHVLDGMDLDTIIMMSGSMP